MDDSETPYSLFFLFLPPIYQYIKEEEEKEKMNIFHVLSPFFMLFMAFTGAVIHFFQLFSVFQWPLRTASITSFIELWAVMVCFYMTALSVDKRPLVFKKTKMILPAITSLCFLSFEMAFLYAFAYGTTYPRIIWVTDGLDAVNSPMAPQTPVPASVLYRWGYHLFGLIGALFRIGEAAKLMHAMGREIEREHQEKGKMGDDD
jgi:hypothetical protein